MINKIPYTSYQGQASELCRKGDAVEFIQPWYTPISTTPENTGMAVGGIGSAFTLTPNGDTPNFSFIPGIFIDCSQDDIHFNDFYASVMNIPSVDDLKIKDIVEVGNYLKYYPAQFSQDEYNLSEVLDVIKNSVLSGDFYKINRASFEKWNVEFSSKTKLALKKNPNAISTQILVALDFFNGLLVVRSAEMTSLTAVSESAVKEPAVANQNSSQIDSISGSQIEYKALYPMAEYDYKAFDDVVIERKVVSPIVKGDKKLCSLPLHWNHFELTNTGSETRLVTLVQPLKNLIGSTYRKGRDGIQDSACYLTQNPISQKHQTVYRQEGEMRFEGVSLASESSYGADIEGEVIYGVRAKESLLSSGKVTVSLKSQMYSTQADDQVVAALQTGRTNNEFDRGIYSGREGLSALVCVQVELEPGESVDLRFVQVMDHSKIALNSWQSDKAYTQFFTEHGRTETMLGYALPKLENIELQIVKQQQEYLEETTAKIEDQRSAEQVATSAMNTLSFLAEATVWDKQDKFLVKECVDYPFFNSLDVYFYGSFSLLYLLPELDGCVMKEFAKAILAQDDTRRRYWEYEDKPNAELVDAKYEGVRAVKGAVIHDLGSPFDIQPDAYSWHNVKEWKDLAPKYILMVYRHYQLTGDRELVEACWPAVKESIDFLSNLIEEGDSLPLTRGTDDTFDNLSSHGISIYCGSLWAAGLKSAAKLADLMQEEGLASDYNQRSNAALTTVEESLWDEELGYYHFFVTPVQAKHLTGVGYEALTPLGLQLTGNNIDDKTQLNDFLNSAKADGPLSKVEVRNSLKQQLIELAPQAFTREFRNLVPDSDNSFGDSLLADTYLKLIGMEGLFSLSEFNVA